MTLEPSPGALVLLTSLSRRVYRRATEDVLGMRLKHASARCRARSRLSVDALAHEVQ
jgi:hypothetical protein